MHQHHHGCCHDHVPKNKKALSIAIIITFGIFLLQLWGSVVSNSLSLLADSIHMIGDVGSLALSLMAIFLAQKASTLTRTFGFERAEIIASFINGLTILGISLWIIIQAILRFFGQGHLHIHGEQMMWIAIVGLIANLISAFVLSKMGDTKGNLNLKSAYLHVLTDALSSVAVIISAIFIQLFHWFWIDTLLSLLIGILILKGGWGVIKASISILMEGTPSSIPVTKVQHLILGVNGVKEVSNLHIWSISSYQNALMCHVYIDNEKNETDIVKEIEQLLHKEFKIRNMTIQVKREKAKITCCHHH